MPPTPKRWDIAPEMPPDYRARFPHLNPLLLQVLYNRAVTDPADVEAFLNGLIRFDDPFRMMGMGQAVERIRRAIARGEAIAVYGDFDADGVTATTLLMQTLKAFGAVVRYYIPHRVDEGYGLNTGAIDRIAASGAGLIVTVDCGVRSPDEVAYASSLGIDTIITDHHSIAWDDAGQMLPPALAVINPRQAGDEYPFKELAGVGLAFKLSQALLAAERTSPVAATPPRLAEEDLLDLVALGTVADVACLLGENRYLVQRGLAQLNHPRRPGVRAMLAESRLQPGRVNSAAIGFVLGPRLNAAGRMETARIAYNLLTARDDHTAMEIARQLGELNRRRQELTQRFVNVARERILRDGAGRYLFLVDDPEFEHGVVGLVAGRLTEEFYRPALVARKDGETTRGSARSIPEFDITRALDRCRPLLKRYGGHAAAAGFTVENDKLPLLAARLEEIATEQLAGHDLRPLLPIDAVVELGRLDWATEELLRQLEPCGASNPQPVFASLGLEVLSQRRVGRAPGGDLDAPGPHLKLTVRDPHATGVGWAEAWDAIAYRQGEWADEMPSHIDLAYTLERNEYNGGGQLQLVVRDWRPAVNDGQTRRPVTERP